MIRCLVFDLDDTLYAERDYVRSGFRAAVQALPAAVRDPVEEDCWKQFIAGTRLNIFDQVLPQHGLHDPLLIASMVARYRDHKPSIALDPTAKPVLLHAKAAGCFLGIITDGRASGQHAKIDSLGLADCVDAIICTDDLGKAFWKPHSRAFIMMAEMAKAAPHECVYVGDNPAKDFLAPNMLGWSTIMLQRDGAVHQNRAILAGGAPQWTVKTLSETLTVLELGPTP